MYKVGVIGDRDSVLCFRAVGFEVFEVVSAKEAYDILKKIKKDFAVIFVISEFYTQIKSEIDETEAALPAIISLPGKNGSDGSGLRELKTAVEKAVGADILGV